ncbi:hypothetical protein [Infirmifilum sp. SLHALR2]|nr:MAG: hypothetical protein B7L53_05145 [Thermofilum sp. NZ13]
MRPPLVVLVAIAAFLLAALLLLIAHRGQVPLEGNATKPSGPPTAQPSPRVATVRIEADVANATASVNWSLRSLPAVLEVPAGSLLVVEPMPAGLYEPLNSTLLLRVTGNVTVTLRYRRSALLVSVKATYPLLVNGEPVRDGTVLRVRLNSSLSFGSACADLGNETALCSDSVRVVRGGVVEEFPLNTTLTFPEDAVVEAAGFRAYRVSFTLPYNLTFTVNGTAYAGNTSIWVGEGSVIVVDASPVSFNDTHDLWVIG